MSSDDLVKRIHAAAASPEAKVIWEELKANTARLDGCQGPHVFEPVPGGRPLRQKFCCSLCGGEVEFREYSWYTRGLAHARTAGGTP